MESGQVDQPWFVHSWLFQVMFLHFTCQQTASESVLGHWGKTDWTELLWDSSYCPSWRCSWHLPFYCLWLQLRCQYLWHSKNNGLSMSMTLPKYIFSLIASLSLFSPLGGNPSSPTELCRSAMPGSIASSSSSKDVTLLPQILSWNTDTCEVWEQNLQVKTVNLFSTWSNFEYFLYWSYCLLSKYLCTLIRTSVINQETK